MTWRALRRNPHEEDPLGLRASLDRLSQSLGAPSARALEVIFAQWEEVVGAAVAAHVRPASLRSGVLVVVADHPSWASEVRWLGPKLLARLAESAGGEVATSLEVRVGRS